jgi:hypothetical protein
MMDNKIHTHIFIPSLKIKFSDEWYTCDSKGPDSFDYNDIIDGSIICGKIPVEIVKLVQELHKNELIRIGHPPTKIAETNETIREILGNLNRIGFPRVVSETLFEKLVTLKYANRQYRAVKNDQLHCMICMDIKLEYEKIAIKILADLERMEMSKDQDNHYFYTAKHIVGDKFGYNYAKTLIYNLKEDKRFEQFAIEPVLLPDKTVVAFYW